MTNNLENVKAMDLISQALTEPGKMLEAYSAFHHFSLNNSMLAMSQLSRRGLDIGPIKTFNQWKEYGRSVKKGEKAITLLMPRQISFKRIDEETGEEKTVYVTRGFMEKNYWFALSQTKEYKADMKKATKKIENSVKRPQWDGMKALAKLQITQEHFSHVNGSCQGYAHGRVIAINPLAQEPMKTMVHEIAHIVLGHTQNKGLSALLDDRSIQEAEAEMTAYLVLSALGEKGLEYCRGYIQRWLSGNEFPEASAKKCIKAAGDILDAGVVKSQKKAA